MLLTRTRASYSSWGDPVFFGFALMARAGEFPDDWTWDLDAAARGQHAAMEGKPAPALDLKEWINGEVKPEAMKSKLAGAPAQGDSGI